jgi:hypothetical protein
MKEIDTVKVKSKDIPVKIFGISTRPHDRKQVLCSPAFGTSPIDISLFVMYIFSMRTLKKKPIQMYIEPRQDTALAVLAKKRGVSKAELIRESIEKYLTTLPLDEDPAMGIVGLGSSSGKGDTSAQHDRYLVKYAKAGRK